jgi:hypothetical protein
MYDASLPIGCLFLRMMYLPTDQDRRDKARLARTGRLCGVAAAQFLAA